MPSVMFVCLGNICRSPAAEGMLRQKAEAEPDLSVTVASSGIGSWHVGALADERMRSAALARGIHLISRAQQFRHADFTEYDLILAADHAVREELLRLAVGPAQKAKVHLITAHSPRYPNHEVPDPYYGDEGGFELVLDMLEDACDGLVLHLKSL